GCEKTQYTIRLLPKSGSKVTPNKPPCPSSSTSGIPLISSDILPSILTIRMLPGFSVIRNRCPGSSAIPQGDLRPVAIILASYGDCVFTPGALVCPSIADLCLVFPGFCSTGG